MATAANETMALAEVPNTNAIDEKPGEVASARHSETTSTEFDSSSISSEDLQKLRRVSGKITWIAFTIAFVELCERFSYYGTTVVFVNFIQQPLPAGSPTGAGFDGQSGALNMGQRASTGLTTFNQFWAYLTPLLGAYIADGKQGFHNLNFHSMLIANSSSRSVQNYTCCNCRRDCWSRRFDCI
jgi:POT family proton-dependent oligopeptide transporter